MREETTLLLEKETVKTKAELKKETKTVKQQEQESVKKLFSQKPSEQVVEKPNFDKISELAPEKRQKIFKVEKEKKAEKTHSNLKLKLILVSFLLIILGAFCITTGVEIAKANQSLQAVESEYSANLLSLMQKIYSTETGNRSLSLFETFPEEDLTASSIYETSNWFDRFCKFLTGFFGG